MRLENESRHLLLLLVLCTSGALVMSWPVTGIHDTNGDSTIPGVTVGPELPDAPLVVTDSTLGSDLGKYSPLVLDCWEKGCRPCQLIDGKIDELAADLKGQVVFGKLNINQNARTTKKYKVFNYPTILIFKKGTLICRHVGDIPKDALEKLILGKLEIR